MSESSRSSKSHASKAKEHSQWSVSDRTLRLFTVQDKAEGDDPTTEAVAASAMSKNPRWLANREKEVKSEAIREKILSLLIEIEAEEARERPALKKAWLQEKKMELRRISFKQPEEIIAGEAYFRRVRQKLREARRRRRAKDGADNVSEDVDSDAEGSDSDKGTDPADDEAATVHRRWTVSGAATAARKAGDSSADNDKVDNNADVFNLSPTGRIARPNPRAKSPKTTQRHQPKGKWQKPMEKVNKVVRFPIESGYKLGRFIRSRREKARGDAAGSAPESAVDSGHWGDHVTGPGIAEDAAGWGQSRRQQSSLSSASSKSGNANEIVIGESDDGGHGSFRQRGSSRSSGSSGSSSPAPEIPVLQQESVGKKIRDRLAGSGGDAGSSSGKKDKKKSWKKPKEKEAKSKKGDESDGATKKLRHSDKNKKQVNGLTIAGANEARSNTCEPVQFVELEDGED